MKEQLISFNTAKLAKEKGFEFTGNSFYCDKYGLCKLGEESLVVEEPFQIILDCNSEFEEGERFYASPQSVLQKWLREKHGVYVHVDCKNTVKPEGHFQVEVTHQNERVYSHYGDDKTYEESLERGLERALNYIE